MKEGRKLEMEKYYKVNESELIDLLTSRVELEALNAGGVDSWVWYGAGFDKVYKEYGPNCKNLRIVLGFFFRTIQR